jgi:4-hydroxy-tetrahydrodipicolinate synthase
MKGIWAAVVTPADSRFTPDASLAIPYYGDLLRRGCDGINALGTTGEAMSFSVDQRLRFMDALAEGMLPLERVMTGTGAASLDDAARLTRHAFECRFAAALVMPPFFYRDASDDGIVAFFDALFARTTPPSKSVLLYNFPRMSGITFHPTLVGRLLGEFPGVIAGMKDSSNDPLLQKKLLNSQSGFLIFPGSESNLRSAIARGAAGCISGSVALWPELAQAVFTRDDESRARQLTQQRAELEGVPFVPAVRRRIAQERGEPAWERAVPPQIRLEPPSAPAARTP